jgi:two-component system, LytTR family, sensor histidine kinase LytS
MNLINRLIKFYGFSLFFLLVFSCQKDKDAINLNDVEKWTYYDTNNGLPSNKIYCLVEDSLNNIWIGTDKGLVKYDGSSFTCYSRNTGLLSDSILSLYWNGNNELLVGTPNGFGKISFTGKYNTVFRSPNMQFTRFCDDRKYPVTYCATNKGIIMYYYKNNFCSKYELDSTSENGKYTPDPIYDIVVDKYNYTWFAAKKGVYIFTNNKIVFNRNYDLGLHDVTRLFKDKSDNIWMASSSDQKIMFFNGSKYVNDSIFFGFNNYKSFAQDQYNNYWISIFNHGVLDYGGGMTKVYNTSNSKIISDNINQIIYDSKKNIWFGSDDKGLMYLQNIKPLQFKFDSGTTTNITFNPINN